jgi:hypothetical protein
VILRFIPACTGGMHAAHKVGCRTGPCVWEEGALAWMCI